jgi:hypothetical protein
MQWAGSNRATVSLRDSGADLLRSAPMGRHTGELAISRVPTQMPDALTSLSANQVTSHWAIPCCGGRLSTAGG